MNAEEIARSVRGIGAHNHDDHPTGIAYATTTGTAIASFFDDDPPTSAPEDAVILAVGYGDFELTHGPTPRSLRFSAVVVAITPTTKNVLAWGAWDDPPDLAGLGPMTQVPQPPDTQPPDTQPPDPGAQPGQ